LIVQRPDEYLLTAQSCVHTSNKQTTTALESIWP
jgi:hypothetical protein